MVVVGGVVAAAGAVVVVVAVGGVGGCVGGCMVVDVVVVFMGAAGCGVLPKRVGVLFLCQRLERSLLDGSFLVERGRRVFDVWKHGERTLHGEGCLCSCLVETKLSAFFRRGSQDSTLLLRAPRPLQRPQPDA